MNEVVALVTRGTEYKTRALYQYDYGQRLVIRGIALPEAYEVHFSNSPDGESTTAIGNSGGVAIPDIYLRSGQDVFAWLYLHTGENDGETVYRMVIPVRKRASVSNTPPTPVQQEAITQAIAALDAGVAEVQDAVSGVGTAIQAALQEAKDSGEFDGKDGVSPAVSVSQITGGHTISITDAQGTETFDVLDGQDGVPGDDGYSPSASVSKSGSTATITITDKTGTTTAKISDGSVTMATDAEVKAGTNEAHVIVPGNQEKAAFYGLAKIAGVDMSGSGNAPGTYTQAAQTAIQKMLGIYQAPWELIREDTVTNATKANIVVSADGDGNPFVLTDIRLLMSIPTHDAETSISDYAVVGLSSGGVSKRSMSLCGNATYTAQANSAERAAYFQVTTEHGMMKMEGMQWQNTGGKTNMQSPIYAADTKYYQFSLTDLEFDTVTISNVTGLLHYKLYGRRKWTT